MQLSEFLKVDSLPKDDVIEKIKALEDRNTELIKANYELQSLLREAEEHIESLAQDKIDLSEALEKAKEAQCQ